MSTKRQGRQTYRGPSRSSPSRSGSRSRSSSRSPSPSKSSSPRNRSTEVIYLRSPKTNRWIKEEGPTYNELLQNPLYASKLKTAERRTEGNLSPKKGQGNAGKYTDADAPFCGPNQTYPVNTPGRYRAAMSYARFSDNPDKIRECAQNIAETRGWSPRRKRN